MVISGFYEFEDLLLLGKEYYEKLFWDVYFYDFEGYLIRVVEKFEEGFIDEFLLDIKEVIEFYFEYGGVYYI